MTTRTRFSFVGLLLVLALVGLALFEPPDGRERAEVLRFFGGLHPLAVHFPIALLLVVPLLEFAGRDRRLSQLRAAGGFVLGLAAVSAIATPFLGWLLAWSGGFEGTFVTQHMWGGISVAAAALLCWTLRGRGQSVDGELGVLYWTMLTLTIPIVAFTGYRGGQLAHGENHLTEHLPSALQTFFGLSNSSNTDVAVPGSTFYAVRIAPIIREHCLVCHGANKHKGGLRMDSYAELMRGGKDGVVINAGNAQGSELVRRVNLDPSNKQFMPAEGKPPLDEDDRDLIKIWINAGASPTVAANAIADAPALKMAAKPQAPDYRSDQQVIASLASSLNVRLIPRSQNFNDGLVLRTAGSPSACDDGTLEKLAPVARYIVDAELARTKISDNGLSALGTFENLRSLDLSHTAITSAGVVALVGLRNLEVLNLTDTLVDDAGAAQLRNSAVLRNVFVFPAKVGALGAKKDK